MRSATEAPSPAGPAARAALDGIEPGLRRILLDLVDHLYGIDDVVEFARELASYRDGFADGRMVRRGLATMTGVHSGAHPSPEAENPVICGAFASTATGIRSRSAAPSKSHS